MCWDRCRGLPPDRNRRRGCTREAMEESPGRSRPRPEIYDMFANSRTNRRLRLRVEGLRISDRRKLKEPQANSHSSISPDSAVQVSIASWSTFRSQALTKSCRDALGDSARRSATNTGASLRHLRRAIRSLRAIKASQLLLHYRTRKKVKMRRTGRVAHREHKRLRRVHGLRPQVLPRVDIVHHLVLFPAAHSAQLHESRKMVTTETHKEGNDANGMRSRTRCMGRKSRQRKSAHTAPLRR